MAGPFDESWKSFRGGLPGFIDEGRGWERPLVIPPSPAEEALDDIDEGAILVDDLGSWERWDEIEILENPFSFAALTQTIKRMYTNADEADAFFASLIKGSEYAMGLSFIVIQNEIIKFLNQTGRAVRLPTPTEIENYLYIRARQKD